MKETSINIDNSNKSTKLSTKHCNSKTFWVLWNVLQNVLFFFTNLSQGNFLYCQRFFIPTKILNTVRTPTWMKQNLFHWFFLSRFCQITKHQSRRVYYFSQSCKVSVFIDDREWILVLLSRMIINHSVATNIQLRKFRFKEGLELG